MRPELKKSLSLAVLSIALLLSTSSLLATELPQYAEYKHLGVATCGNSTCHAVTQLDEPGNVRQNEYLSWLFHDRHSSAYKTLLTEQSKQIAAKLGLPDAASADICLDCHADNVPEEKRGPEFLITDGVGCEACHGGAEKWISSHTITPYNSARNLADGMYPTGPLAQRTELCVSCHVGTEKKLANHAIMGAGHPRTGFELDTFTIRQPDHYTVDADYIERKNLDNPVLRVLLGTAVQAQQVATNLSGGLVDHPQGHPEVALYDCHSCHHSLKDLQWKQRPSTKGLQPGAIRLNDSSFILLAALTGALDKPLQSSMLKGISALHSASSRSVGELQAQARNLLKLARQGQAVFTQSDLNQQKKIEMLNVIMDLGIRGEYRDYVAAEQAVMAMDALSYSLPPDEKLAQLINRAYQFTENDEVYQPQKFQKALAEYRKQ